MRAYFYLFTAGALIVAAVTFVGFLAEERSIRYFLLIASVTSLGVFALCVYAIVVGKRSGRWDAMSDVRE